MSKVLNYSNGLRAVVQNLPHSHSVSVGIWVNAGSRKENASNNGISHFLEHLIFKGTDKMSAFEIAQGFEALGATINAFTSKDCTCYMFKCISDTTEECFKNLSHIFLDSVFDKAEMDRERNVVIEEIGMVDDAPEEVCFDLLSSSLYDGPLAQTILGPAENILKMTRDDILKYMADHYTADNIVVSMAGNITTTQADKLIKKYFLDRLSTNPSCKDPCDSKFSVKHTVEIDDYEQSNLIIAFPSIEIGNKLLPVQTLLSVILGGGMGSRLFQKVREQQGLAYSIYTTPTVHVGSGSFNICVNFSAANTKKVMDCIRGEVDLLLKEGVTQEEFCRAKAQLKASKVFASESTQAQMLSFGKVMLLLNEVYDMDKKLKQINAVTIKDLMDFSKALFCKKPALVYLGKQPDEQPKW